MQGASSPALGPLLGAAASAGGAVALMGALQTALHTPALQAALAAPRPLQPVTRQLLASALVLDEGGASGAGAAGAPTWFSTSDGRFLAAVAPLVQMAAQSAQHRLPPLLANQVWLPPLPLRANPSSEYCFCYHLYLTVKKSLRFKEKAFLFNYLEKYSFASFS